MMRLMNMTSSCLDHLSASFMGRYLLVIFCDTSSNPNFLLEKTADLIYSSPGCGYYFAPFEVHGLEVLEEAQIIEAFSPMRPEYIADLGLGVPS